jgi:hypothetical protein
LLERIIDVYESKENLFETFLFGDDAVIHGASQIVMLRLLSTFATKWNGHELTPIAIFLISVWNLISHCGCQAKVFLVWSGTYVRDETGEEGRISIGNTLHRCIK